MSSADSAKETIDILHEIGTLLGVELDKTALSLCLDKTSLKATPSVSSLKILSLFYETTVQTLLTKFCDMSFLKNCLPSNAHGQIVAAKEDTYNVIIMMHGLGDSEYSFAHAAKNIPLPNTSYISLRGVYRLPLDFGTPEGNWMWGEDVHFDTNGNLESEADFSKCLSVLRELVKGITDQGILSTRIYFFGFGQGGMAALYCVSQLASIYQFGGVFSFGGKLPLAMTLPSSPLLTSVYFFEKRKNSSIDDYEEGRLKKTFRSVQRICWNRDEKTDMPSSPNEWLVFVEAISKKLYVHNKLYEDAIQLS